MLRDALGLAGVIALSHIRVYKLVLRHVDFFIAHSDAESLFDVFDYVFRICLVICLGFVGVDFLGIVFDFFGFDLHLVGFGDFRLGNYFLCRLLLNCLSVIRFRRWFS